MRQWLQKHRRLMYWSFIIVVALSLLYFLFLGRWVENVLINARLASAKANWEASGIKSYYMIVDVNAPFSMYPIGRISMTVKDGLIVEAEQKDLFDFTNQNYDPDKAPLTPIDPERVSRYTMDNLFEDASDYIDHRIGQITLDFSPPPLSYIIQYSEDCYNVIPDCGFSYAIQEFEPLK